jgi:hypothetical protein
MIVIIIITLTYITYMIYKRYKARCTIKADNEKPLLVTIGPESMLV